MSGTSTKQDWAYSLEDGQYVLRDDKGEVVLSSPEVAFMVDMDTGCRLKHGAPADVNAYFSAVVSQYSQRGFPVKQFVVFSGKFPLEEVNKCLQISDYPGRYYKQLMCEHAIVAQDGSSRPSAALPAQEEAEL